MQSPKDQSPPVVSSSCRKNKKDDATFFENVKDRIDELIHSSMDEYVTCFKITINNTMNKMFGSSKIVAQSNSEALEVDSVSK